MKLDKTEFDKFADEYTNIHKDNIRVSGEAPSFFSEYKIKDLHSIVKVFGLSPKLASGRDSVDGDSGFVDRNLRRSRGVRLLAQHAVAFRLGARHRDRRR